MDGFGCRFYSLFTKSVDYKSLASRGQELGEVVDAETIEANHLTMERPSLVLKRLLLTFLVVAVVILLGLRYRLGSLPTVLAACVAGIAANFLVPRH